MRRYFDIFFAACIGLAFAGLAVGLGPEPTVRWIPPKPLPVESTELPQVPPYHLVDNRARGPNAVFFSHLDRLSGNGPALSDKVVQTLAEKQSALALRASRRAYAGAPPAIPHPVDANQVASCLLCHGEGKRIDSIIAPKMSHPPFTNCTQCHVQAATPGLGPSLPVENAFIGLTSPTGGTRAWPGAPPTMPHQVWMRQQCTSCHGLLGRPGLRTTHPERVNCLQCHAQDAAADHRDFSRELTTGR
ncbi:hypothetical protein LBMAG53_08670 [Planctomycetota bacterium]|nr:hypothetical protein LBMAG53_08670 [Planctomycetota bacterium]